MFATSGVLRSGEFYWVISFWCFVGGVVDPFRGSSWIFYLLVFCGGGV